MKPLLKQVVLLAALLVSTKAVAVQQASAPLQPTPFERFVKQSSSRIAWSSEVARFEAGGVSAVLTAIVAEDSSEPAQKMSGLRVELASPRTKDVVYVAEADLPSLRKAVNDIQSSVEFSKNRPSSNAKYRYLGAEEFWRPNGVTIHELSVAYFIDRDGDSGTALSSSSDPGQFKLPNVLPSRLIDAIDVAINRLRNQ